MARSPDFSVLLFGCNVFKPAEHHAGFKVKRTRSLPVPTTR